MGVVNQLILWGPCNWVSIVFLQGNHIEFGLFGGINGFPARDLRSCLLWRIAFRDRQAHRWPSRLVSPKVRSCDTNSDMKPIHITYIYIYLFCMYTYRYVHIFMMMMMMIHMHCTLIYIYIHHVYQILLDLLWLQTVCAFWHLGIQAKLPRRSCRRLACWSFLHYSGCDAWLQEGGFDSHFPKAHTCHCLNAAICRIPSQHVAMVFSAEGLAFHCLALSQPQVLTKHCT